MKGPTARQLVVLDFMREFVAREGMPPSIREIMDNFHYASSNAAIDVLKSLEKKGLVERTRHGSRKWRPTMPGVAVRELGPHDADAAVVTVTLSTADALSVGENLRALARTAPEGARVVLDRVGAQLASAGRFAMAGAR